MIRVTVYGALSTITQGHDLSAEAGSIKELIETLSQRFGEDFRRAVKASKIYHNGKNVAFFKGTKTKLSTGDEVVFLSPVAGG
ncbi:MAG: MoaD/ThiS family protein [Bradymonadales bacterium]|nr:MoaD/ThiS family protein [Bradymonadales bacterium]